MPTTGALRGGQGGIYEVYHPKTGWKQVQVENLNDYLYCKGIYAGGQSPFCKDGVRETGDGSINLTKISLGNLLNQEFLGLSMQYWVLVAGGFFLLLLTRRR